MRILNFETSPVIGHHIFLGHYWSYYRRQFAKYLYYQGQGEMIVGQIESLLYMGGLGTMIAVGAKYLWGWNIPFWGIVLLAVGLKILKVYLGRLDKKVLKLGQAVNNYGIEEGVNPKAVEQLERIKNIEKKVSPETAEKKYETYFEK